MPGRHFLQIPGPTNVPDRCCARSRSRPSITAARRSRALGREVLDGLQRVFQTTGPVVIYPVVRHRRVGSGARQHAVARRHGADVRDRPFRDAVARHGRRGSACRSTSSPATGATASIRRSSSRSSPTIAPARSRPSRSCTTRRRPASPRASPTVRRAMDAAQHPALLLVDAVSSLGSIDYRHDEWGVDVTVSSSQKGMMLPPGLGFNAISEKALAASTVRAPAAGLLGLGSRCSGTTRPDSSRPRRRPTCSTGCARPLRC